MHECSSQLKQMAKIKRTKGQTLFYKHYTQDRYGRDRMVVRFVTTYVISDRGEVYKIM